MTNNAHVSKGLLTNRRWEVPLLTSLNLPDHGHPPSWNGPNMYYLPRARSWAGRSIWRWCIVDLTQLLHLLLARETFHANHVERTGTPTGVYSNSQRVTVQVSSLIWITQ